MLEWQPIETAPRDGTAILATNANYEYDLQRCVVVFWDDDELTEQPGWSLPYETPDDAPFTWLTHWMPLPEPPNA